MAFTLKELASSLGAQSLGDEDFLVEKLAEPAQAGPKDLALAVAPKFAADLAASAAQAAVVWPGADLAELGLKGAIIAPRGRLAMAGLTQAMEDDPTFNGLLGIHASAVIDPSATIGEGAAIGAFTFIGAGAVIGEGAKIANHVSIGPGVILGDQARLHEGVRICARVRIGARFVAQPGAVIGGDGFSFTTAGPSNVERAVRQRGGLPLDPPESGAWHKIHSLGGVEIGDGVEMGANSTIDAGTIRATRIGNGVKIDNLVQIGHNVVLGEDCLICAQAAIAGSSVLGPRCILGGKSGVADNLTIGRDVVAGGAAMIFSDIADGVFVSGHPALPTHEYRAGQKALRRLARPSGSGVPKSGQSS